MKIRSNNAEMLLRLNVIIILHYSLSAAVSGKIFHVKDFGAYPNDRIDDATSIQRAVHTAIAYEGNSIVSFDSGAYNLLSTIEIFNATNLTIQGRGMHETLLVGNGSISIFYGIHCQDFIISNISIDYYPRPFTAGFIVNLSETYADVKVEPPHETDVDRLMRSMFRYDPVLKRPAIGPNAYQIFQQPSKNDSTTVISPGVVRVPLKSRSKFVINDPVVIIYSGSAAALEFKYVTDITLQSITIFNSWLMGIVIVRAKRLNIIDYHAKLHDDYWLSTNSDCTHITDSREYVHISNTKCQSTGDDGLAVHAVYFLVTEVINSTALLMQIFGWTDPLDIGDNTTLQFSHSEQPFTAYMNATVASSIANSSNLRLFVFTNELNVNIGDFACVADSPVLIVRNYTAERIRGRGALLQTHNIDVRQSIFNRTSAPAILFQPSLFWKDGPPARNVTLTENLFLNCNEGISQKKGIITFLPDPIQRTTIFNDISITSSTFYFGNYTQGLLQSDNVQNLFFNGNYLAINSSTAIISICNSRNITAANNTLVNRAHRIEQYYTYDETEPCAKNLSSLIDLPPSAFNSSFSPPV